jgi:hypothetical protein
MSQGISRTIVAKLAAAAGAVLMLPACSAAWAARAPQAVSRPAGCHARDHGRLPNPACTPGITWQAVTQATIRQTICRPGWTKTVRPPESYTQPLKLRQIARYGYASTWPAGYEEDHLIPLELGGAPRDPRNLWPERGPSPNAKDRVENALRRAVCDGRVSLRAAQRVIAADWETALAQLGLGPPQPSPSPSPSPPSPSPSLPSHPGCYPLTSGGNCYEPGEFCPLRDHGMTGVAGDGERIVCKDNSGWRWEPY